MEVGHFGPLWVNLAISQFQKNSQVLDENINKFFLFSLSILEIWAASIVIKKHVFQIP